MELENILQSFRRPYGQRFYGGLERIKAILELLGNPQNNFLSIHIAGTNGKGSVSSLFSNIFTEFGLKVGLFTSPHLERFTERVQINGIEINENVFLDILKNKTIPAIEKIDNKKYDTATEFEAITVTAFYYFCQQKVHIAVIEAGLGGKTDSTNILENILFSVITNISQDHTDRLGKNLEEITAHKAGIIKPSTDIITTTLNSEKALFFQTVKELNNSQTDYLHFSHPNLIEMQNLSLSESIDNQRIYIDKDQESIFFNKPISSYLIAKYQKENIALVLKSLNVLAQNIYQSKNSKLKLEFSQDEFIEKSITGINKTKWAGRFELFQINDINLIIDGAHNDNGMQSFTDSIKELVNTQETKIITIFACNKDKEYAKMIDYLSQITETFIITKSHVEIKAKDPQNISEYLKFLNKDHKIVKDYRQTIDFACKIISERNYNKKNVLICVCGSLYLVGGIRELINPRILGPC